MSLSGQFVMAEIGSAYTEISQYIQNFTLDRSSADTDLTTFNTGATPVTERHRRGAATSKMTLNCLYDPTFWKIARQYHGSRAGFNFRAKSGSNNLPTIGDELFTGLYTNLRLVLTYNTGAVATLAFDLDVAEGSTEPKFGKV